MPRGATAESGHHVENCIGNIELPTAPRFRCRSKAFGARAAVSLAENEIRITAQACSYTQRTRAGTNSTGAQLPQSATRIAAFMRSAPVRRPNAEPAVANLLVMHARIVGRGRQLEHLR